MEPKEIIKHYTELIEEVEEQPARRKILKEIQNLVKNLNKVKKMVLQDILQENFKYRKWK